MATRIQTKSNDAASATTIDAILDSPVTAGNKLVVFGKQNVDFTPTGGMVTDTLGNTYAVDWDLTAATAGVDNVGDLAVWSTISGSSGACTVTFNPGVAAGRIAIAVREYNGLGVHDGTTRNAVLITTTASPTSGAFTPSAATGVIFAFIIGSQTPTWEGEYGDATVNVNGGRLWTAVDESVTAASQSADATQASAVNDCGALWYPDAGGGGGPAALSVRMSEAQIGGSLF
jgi:hypothetical protein